MVWLPATVRTVDAVGTASNRASSKRRTAARARSAGVVEAGSRTVSTSAAPLFTTASPESTLLCSMSAERRRATRPARAERGPLDLGVTETTSPSLGDTLIALDVRWLLGFGVDFTRSTESWALLLRGEEEALEPVSSACAIPEPLASAAPTPNVIAPAPNHAPIPSCRRLWVRRRPRVLLPLAEAFDPRTPATAIPRIAVKTQDNGCHSAARIYIRPRSRREPQWANHGAAVGSSWLAGIARSDSATKCHYKL